MNLDRWIGDLLGQRLWDRLSRFAPPLELPRLLPQLDEYGEGIHYNRDR